MEWPDRLIDSIARRKCVLFLGAGVSANSTNAAGKHPATWENFLRDILKKREKKLSKSKNVIEKLLSEKDFLTACEIIVNILGGDEFGELASDEFRRPGYAPSDIHREIYRLDSRIIVTPNIDRIYEQYAITESNGTVVVKTYYEDDVAKYLRTNDILMIRSHGDVDRSSSLIFTHEQYSFARSKYASFYKILDALILTHTFIFLGCGINDPDIQLTLENQSFLYPGCRPHYFVTAENTYEPEIEQSIVRNRNLEIVTYKNEDGTHSNFLLALKDLNENVEEARMTIAQNQTW